MDKNEMNTGKLSMLAVASALAMALVSAQAVAAPMYCVPGPNSDGLALDNLTFNGSNSNDCYGVVAGNASLTTINSLSWGSDWTLLDKTDAVGATFEGLLFTLTSDTSKPDGNWWLNVTDTNGAAPQNLPTMMDLVFALKASDSWAGYLFTGIAIDTTQDSGTYHISWNNNGGQIAGFSHMSLYGRFADPSSSSSSGSTSSSSTGGQTSGSIPEPGMVSLLGIGLLGQAWLLRQRRRRLQQG